MLSAGGLGVILGFQLELGRNGVDAILNHPRAVLARRLLGYHAVEDQLHAIGPAEVQIVANDLFEELAPAQRPVEDYVKLTSICQIDRFQS